MGYDFTGGRIFDFSIDFSIGLTTVQRYCAACDISFFPSRRRGPRSVFCIPAYAGVRSLNSISLIKNMHAYCATVRRLTF